MAAIFSRRRIIYITLGQLHVPTPRFNENNVHILGNQILFRKPINNPDNIIEMQMDVIAYMYKLSNVFQEKS